MTGKIIEFPISKEYEQFIKTSHSKLLILIQACNMSNEKGFLNNWQFKALLDYCGVNIDRDFTSADRAILQFHIDNYWNLDS